MYNYFGVEGGGHSVGYFDKKEKWQHKSFYELKEDAAESVAELNKEHYKGLPFRQIPLTYTVWEFLGSSFHVRFNGGHWDHGYTHVVLDSADDAWRMTDWLNGALDAPDRINRAERKSLDDILRSDT